MATASSPINSEAAAKAGEGALRNLPTDAFVEILLRLPLRSRWRCRVVSRHWRAVIDERTPRRSQPKALAFCMDNDYQSCWAYVIDNLADGRCREIWRHRGTCTAMVGTCNGLLCLFSTSRDLTLVNPVTGETLLVPPHPGRKTWLLSSKTFSFGFHPPTGLYKIVRLYAFADRFYNLQAY